MGWALPAIYYKENHNINPGDIDKEVRFVISLLKRKGYTTYLVGGSVRDLLKNKKPKDFDVGTTAKPLEVKRLFKRAVIVGRRFPIVHVRVGGKIIEVATFRKGGNSSADLIKRDASWGPPEDDAVRRDFTINALFYDPDEETIVDYVGGMEDSNKSILRAIGVPTNRFKQDPVRILRMFKFAAQGFDIHDESMQAVHSCKSLIVKSASARIIEYLFMLLYTKQAALFFESLYNNKILHILFPVLCNKITSGELLKKFIINFAEKSEKVKLALFSRSSLIAILMIVLYKDAFKNRREETITSREVRELMESAFLGDISFPKNLYKEASKSLLDYRVLYATNKVANSNKKNIDKSIISKIDAEKMVKILEMLMVIFPNLKKDYKYIKFLIEQPKY